MIIMHTDKPHLSHLTSQICIFKDRDCPQATMQKKINGLRHILFYKSCLLRIFFHKKIGLWRMFSIKKSSS